MDPDGEDLDLAVGAGTAVFAGDVWVDAEEALEVSEDVRPGHQRRDEQSGEDQAEQEQYVVLHGARVANDGSRG